MAPIITPAQTASAEEIRLLIHALRKTCLFQHASESDLFKLAMDMERVAFSPGDTLGPVEGQPQTHLFVVTAGRCVRHSAGHLVDERYYNHDLFPGTTAPWLVEQQHGGGSNSDGKTSASSHKLLTAGGTSGDASASSSQQQSVVVRAVSASENKYGFTKNKSTVDIMCPDRPGLVAHVAAALRAQGLSIERSTLKTTHTQPRKKSIGTPGLLARVWPGGGTNNDGNGANADGNGEGVVATNVEEEEVVEQLQHTAYQNHEVVDATTNEPVTDPARMRRVEAAVLWALQKSVLPGTGRHGTVLQSRSSTDLAAARAMQQGGEGSNNESSAIVESSNGKAAAVKSIVPNGSYMTPSSSVGGYGGVNSFGTLQCLGELPSFATTTAVTSGVCWRLSSRALEDAIRGGGGGRASAEDQDHQEGRITSSSTTSALASRQQIKAQQPFNVDDKKKQRDLAVDIASGLAAEVFRMSNSYSTPLFDQPAQKVNVAAVSVAAAFESYYRSALNSFLNASISSAMTNGAKKAASAGAAAAAAGAAASAAAKAAAPKPSISLGSMFPEMHVQIPTRVMYINGFKLSRQYLAELVEEPAAAATARGDERSRSTIMLIPALLPGVLMTPISSVLEACNAGHANPEHLSRRWIRGLVPRCGREIIFGLGLNNLTDWAEERIPRSVAETKVMRNALGSITAGVIAGYLSHVPHNLSTMKLLDPSTSYRGHVASLVRASSQRVPSALPEGVHAVTSAALALLWPKGLGIRTTQVVGSFVLLNGISHLLDQR